MPWIFLTLLLANLAYFGWGMMQDSSAPRIKVAVSDTIPTDKRLVLLSERRDLGGAPNASGTAASSAVVAQVNVPLCYTVGPFAGDNQPGRFVDRVEAKHLTTRVDEEQNNSFDYWVFISPQVDRARAEERLQALHKQGIESSLVEEDPFANAISLGHFTSEDQASAFRNKMIAASVQAELRKIPKSGTERWVFVTGGNTKADVGKIIDGALGGISSVSKQPAPCET
jgi:hypothetical protein